MFQWIRQHAESEVESGIAQQSRAGKQLAGIRQQSDEMHNEITAEENSKTRELPRRNILYRVHSGCRCHKSFRPRVLLRTTTVRLVASRGTPSSWRNGPPGRKPYRKTDCHIGSGRMGAPASAAPYAFRRL